MTIEQFKETQPGISQLNINKYYKPVIDTMVKYSINTPLRQSHFLSQIGHESCSFIYYKELDSGAKYDTGKLAKELGNTPGKDGDGQKYKGRGVIQITGRFNYLKFSKIMFGDERLLVHPELLELPQYGVEAAGIFWNLHNLNNLADKDDIRTITLKINGGLNGFDDRKKRLDIAKKVLIV